MRYVMYAVKGRVCPGVLAPDGTRVVSLREAGLCYKNLEELARFSTREEWAQLSAWLKEHADSGTPLSQVTLLPAMPAPTQEILVMENNFVKDGEEHHAFEKEKQGLLPTYFYKKATCANVDGGRIPTYPGHVTQLDYQAELCAVVAGDVYQCPLEEAESRIFGYTIINNVIARNLTKRHRRPYIATSLDGFLPMCAYLVTPDEIQTPIRIRSYVNGELRQDDTTDHAKFSFAYAIADLSRISVLRGGSILTLGTPYGCGSEQIPRKWLRSGDVVTCEAEGIGSITNVVE